MFYFRCEPLTNKSANLANIPASGTKVLEVQMRKNSGDYIYMESASVMFFKEAT